MLNFQLNFQLVMQVKYFSLKTLFHKRGKQAYVIFLPLLKEVREVKPCPRPEYHEKQVKVGEE